MRIEYLCRRLNKCSHGELDTDEGLRGQALRMFDDPRTRASFNHFHEQLERGIIPEMLA
jgi:hypothetical protein